MTQRQTTAPSPLRSLRDVVCSELRIRVLIALTNRKASVAELAQELGADKGTIAHHVKKLRNAEMVEVVETRKTRGPDESFYRAVRRPLMDDAESASLSDSDRLIWVERILAMILADASASMQTGIFAERADHNIVRYPTSVDEQGWRELGEILGEALQKAMNVEAESAARMLESGEDSIPVRFATMLFEMPIGVDARQ